MEYPKLCQSIISLVFLIRQMENAIANAGVSMVDFERTSILRLSSHIQGRKCAGELSAVPQTRRAACCCPAEASEVLK
jgi:hypothetical protein